MDMVLQLGYIFSSYRLCFYRKTKLLQNNKCLPEMYTYQMSVVEQHQF